MTDSEVGAVVPKATEGTLKTEAPHLVHSESSPKAYSANLEEDEQSQLSSSSLFSDRDDDSFSSTETKPYSLKELEMEFKKRDELLDQLLIGIDPIYASIMRENEKAVRKQKMSSLKQELKAEEPELKEEKKEEQDNAEVSEEKENEEQDDHYVSDTPPSLGDTTNSNGTTIAHTNATSTITYMEQLHRAVAFDIQNVLPGAISLILNCIAFNGCLEVLEIFILLFSSEEDENAILLPSLILVASIMVLRITGGIFEWVSDDVFVRVKFDMHNRLRLGNMDAKLVRWFHRHEHVRTFFNAFAFFACSFAVNHFQDQVLGMACDKRESLFEELPSVKHGVITSVSKRVAAGLSEEHLERLLADSSCVAGVCSLDEFHDDLTRQDEAFLLSEISRDCFGELMGSDSAVLVTEWSTFWFSAASVIVTIILLRMMGIRFWTM